MRLFNFMCATIVFEAYRRLGYYSLGEFRKAVKSYFAEKEHLGGTVLSVKKWGLPVGTLMCAKDEGWLPTDLGFPVEMDAIRVLHGDHLGYLGKFAVVPGLQGQGVGMEILTAAVGIWAPKAEVRTFVMMVHPRHVRLYQRFGAVEIARIGGTAGLEKAPAVLLTLEFADLFRKLRELRGTDTVVLKRTTNLVIA